MSVKSNVKNQGKKSNKALALYSEGNSPRSNTFVTFISRNFTSTGRLLVLVGSSQRWFHFGSWKIEFLKLFLSKWLFLFGFRETNKQKGILMFLNVWKLQIIIDMWCLQQRLISYSAPCVSEAQPAAQQRKTPWGRVVHCCPLVTDSKTNWGLWEEFCQQHKENSSKDEKMAPNMDHLWIKMIAAWDPKDYPIWPRKRLLAKPPSQLWDVKETETFLPILRTKKDSSSPVFPPTLSWPWWIHLPIVPV